ncbi:MAG: type II toxin-antitoxin system RelE/ParE family toxin [Verrucomicrobia bacterium]|nr:type II toxin-antitoxin system RelE/ParE family toxin [Verrucomicrobiota bacterium]
MSRQIIFEHEARLEFEEAVFWYEEQPPGLGDRLEAEVHAALSRILEDPERFPFAGKTVRKTRLEVFDSYSVYFTIEPTFIGIVSVFHGARDPAELRRRLK